jgi:hypothetical protein
VPRPKHLPHAAVADLVYDDVITQDLALVLPLVDLARLVLGKPGRVDEFASKVLGRLRRSVGGQALPESSQLVGREQTGADQILGELLQRDSHRIAPDENGPMIVACPGKDGQRPSK